MPQISSTARSVPGSGIRRIFELAADLPDVIQLSVGEPEERVAPHILDAGARAWQNDATNYTPNSGLLLLRSALVGKLGEFNGYAVDEDQVHITAGGSQALHMAMLLTLDAGDEVLIPDPGYATFAMASRLVGAVPVPYRLTAEHGFRPRIDDLEQLVGPRTRVLLINSPSNPLGVVFEPEVLRELLDFAARHDLWVISDEVYEYFTFHGGYTSVASLDPNDRVFSVYSLSKTYGLTGGRIGYLVTPPGVAGAFRAAQEAIVSCVNTPAQFAALAAVEGDQSAIADAREHYRSNLAAAGAALDARGIEYYRPDGAFYLWVNVSYCSNGNVAQWAEEFLLSQRVAVAPGSAFGAGGEGWIRICAAGQRKPLLTALSRLPAV